VTAILAADGLDVFYGASQILFGVSFAVEEGQTVALLGRNGAGKSTTFKALAGLAPPRSGSVEIRGRDISRAKPHRIARAGIGYVPEDRQVFPEHSVEDNLTIAAKVGAGGQTVWTLETVYDVFPIVRDLRHRVAGRLSGGEQQNANHRAHLDGQPRCAVA